MIKRYNYEFPDGTNDLSMELYAFRNRRTVDQGGLGAYEHFRKAVDLLWNCDESSIDFIWSPEAEDMAYDACENDYLSVAGPASSGKSHLFAAYGIVTYLAGPTDTIVIITSTTLREARRRVWKSATDLWVARPGLPGKLVDSLGQIKGMRKTKKAAYQDGTGLVLIPAEKKREREAIGKLVGIHQSSVLLIADELPEISESLVHAAYTNLSTSPQFQMVGLGNPNSRFDAHGVFSKPVDGWGSVNESDMEWETARGKCIRFDAEQSRNYLEGKQIYAWMPTREKVDQAKRDYGAKSLLYYRMFKAFWAPDGATQGIFSEADLIGGSAVSKAVFDVTPKPVLVASVDPSFTAGGDRSIAYFGTVGNEGGIPVLQFDDFEVLEEDIQDKTTPRTQQIARAFRDACVNRGVLPDNAAVDSTGGGGPFSDVLAAEWSDRFLRVSFSGKASKLPVSATDRTPSHDRYYNRMSEIWYSGQELLRSNQLRGVCDELAREMVSRTYTTTKGSTARIKVEPKVDYKMRVGKSPDLADAAFILVDLGRQRHGLLGGERFEVSREKQTEWKGMMGRISAANRGFPSLNRNV